MEVAPSAANILHSNAAEGHYVTWRDRWDSTLTLSCCGHLGFNWTPFLVHLRYDDTKHFNSWNANTCWHWRNGNRRVIAVITSPYPERKTKNLYYAEVFAITYVKNLSLLHPSGHYMYRTVVTICTASGYYMYHTVVTICTASGHYMYRTVVTICTASLTFINSTFSPHSVFVCFVWIWEQTAIISLYSVNWLVFITETECLLRGTDWVFRGSSG